MEKQHYGLNPKIRLTCGGARNPVEGVGRPPNILVGKNTLDVHQTVWSGDPVDGSDDLYTVELINTAAVVYEQPLTWYEVIQ